MVVKKNLALDTDTTLGGNSASDEVVASQKAVKAYVDNASFGTGFASKTLDNTFSGNNTFTGSLVKAANSNAEMQVRISDYVRGNTPTSTIYGIFKIADANGSELGLLYKSIAANGDTSTRMTSQKLAGGGSAQIVVGFNSNGNEYTYAPACDINNSIVTTVNKTQASNGYYKLGNGLIIQWGVFSSQNPTVIFPTPFSNTNYSVTVTESRTSTNADSSCWNSKTNTQVKLYTQQGSGNWIAIGY